jgi:hypothetical protein
MVNPRRVIFASLNSCSEVDAFIPLDQAFDPVLTRPCSSGSTALISYKHRVPHECGGPNIDGLTDMELKERRTVRLHRLTDSATVVTAHRNFVDQ